MRPGLRAALLILVVGSIAALAPAQQLSARQQEFINSFKNLVELQDLRGISRLAAKNFQTTDEVLLQYSFKFIFSGDVAHLDEVRMLVTAADEHEQGKRFQGRWDRLRVATDEQRDAWLKSWNAWAKSSTLFAEAHQKKDAVEYKRALIELQATLELAAAAQDPEVLSIARYHVGFVHEQLGEYPEVVVAFDKAMDEWLAAGRPKEGMYQHMVDKRRELIEQGNDPLDKGKAEGAAGTLTKKNSTTSYLEGSDWQDWTTSYREMKDASEFPSIAPWGVDHLLLWRHFSWTEGSHPFGELIESAPFGKPLSVLRDGSKGFFDLDGDKKESKGDQPCKVIDGRPNLNVIKSGEGKEADHYAVFMASGGAGQSFFGNPLDLRTSGFYRIGFSRECKILGEAIHFIDDNCSGVFGDSAEQQDRLWRDYPVWIDCDAVVIGKGKPQPWSDVLQVGGKWYHFKPVDGRPKVVRTRELAIETGQVVVAWNGPVQPRTLVLKEIRDFAGCYYDVAGGKPVTVPAGRYEIAFGRIETGKGAQARQAWIFKGDSPAVDVKPGETLTLELGGPLVVDFKAEDKGKSLVVLGKSLIIKEKTGAILGRIFDELPLFEVAVRKREGSATAKPKAMTKVPIETFNSDVTARWFPADFVVEKSEKAELEVQLSLKKHSLLGGPITSDWK